MDMAYLADMHIHSIYSYDGQMRIESVIKRGLELGLKYLAFTEHIELDQITLKQVVNRYKCYYIISEFCKWLKMVELMRLLI